MITQLKQITKKGIKKLLAVFILVWLWAGLFFHNTVNAENPPQDNATTQIQKMSETNQLFTYVSRIIYALLWPVLFITGILLDNRLVYWSFLHLDAALWSLWNIMKNFANFALGFMVLFAIVRNIFTAPFGSKSWDKWGPVSIIKKTLIAGILIQASWFLIAAVVDISTILTYSIWWLPMTVLQQDSSTANLPVLGVNATLTTKSDTGNAMALDIYYTYWDEKIAPCDTREVPSLTGDFIVWRQKIFVSTWVAFKSWYCTLGWRPVRYKENPVYITGSNSTYKENLKSIYESTGNQYTAEDFSGWLESCHIMPKDLSKLSTACAGYGILDKNDSFFKSAGDWSSIKYTIDNLLDKSKWFVWPFVTIYSSILDYSNLASDTEGKGPVSDFLELIIKLFFAVILFIPLLVFAVILLVRIGTLWLVIAASPILMLWWVFKDLFKFGWWDNGLLKSFEMSNVIRAIFAPVFIVFAISMSIIFLTALDAKNPKDEQTQLSHLGIDTYIWEDNKKTYSVLWLVDLTLDMDGVSDWKDIFAWFIMMFFATGIVWFFLFFAIKMTKVADKFSSGIKESMEKLAWSLPIIPLPWGGAVWISAAKTWLGSLRDKISTDLNTSQTQLLKEKYPWLYWDAANNKKRWEDLFAKLSSSDKSKILWEIKWWQSLATVFETHKSTLSAAGIASVESLASTFNTYAVNNITNVTNDFIGKAELDDNSISTFKAEAFTVATIENMVRSDENWTAWAKNAVGTNVKTRDGVRVLVNEWVHNRPVFKLLDIDDYNKKYLPKTKEWSLDIVELEKKLGEKYNHAIKESNDKNNSNWEKSTKEWIQEQLEKHKKQAQKRIDAQSKSSQPSSQSAEESTEE